MKTPLTILGLVLASSSSFAAAQDVQEGKPAIAIYFGGLEQVLADPSDQGLQEILGVLDERVMELAAETGQQAPPKSIVDLAFDLARAPMSLRIGLGDLSNGIHPGVVWAQLDVKAKTPEEALRVAQSVEQLLGGLPFPLTDQPDHPGIKLIDMGNGMGVQLGTRRAADGTGTYFITWGEPRAGDMDLASFGMRAGERPLLAFGLDVAELKPAIEMGLSMAGEDAAPVRKQIEMMNLLGDHPMVMKMAISAGAERMHSSLRMENWLPMAQSMHQFVDQRLSPKDFSMIPADATMASLQITNVGAVLEQLRSYASEEQGISGTAVIEMVEGFLGIELGAQFLDTFGHVQGFYASEGTGGGGLASMISFISIKDEALLRQTMGGLSDNYLGLAQGRARFTKWSHGGLECITVNTPGLPIPLEISMAFCEGYLFFGLSRTSLAGALDHVLGRLPSLIEAKGLGVEMEHPLADSMMFGYGDSAFMMRDGYAPVSLLYAALANAAQSPTDETRDFGMVMPSYRSLKRLMAPQVMLAWVEGSDLMVQSSASSSFTANLVAMAGHPIVRVLVPALVAGVGVGALAGTQLNDSLNFDPMPTLVEEPSHSQVQSDLTMLGAGIELYIIENEGQAPQQLSDLLNREEGGNYIWMDSLPLDPWGNSYHYVPSGSSEESYQLSSWGQDGAPGGEGDAADIIPMN